MLCSGARTKGFDAYLRRLFRSGLPASRQGEAHGDEHRAHARGPYRLLRLKIWRKTQAATEGATPVHVEGDLLRLYEHEAPRMRRWLSSRYAPDKAADLVQTAFVRMLGLGAERFAALERPRAYLYRVADNLAHDHARSSSFRLECQEDADHSSSEDPCAALEARDMLRRIEAAIPLLPDRTREIFMAHRFEDLTYDEIAKRLGISIKTVEMHISAALRELHRAVGNGR